MRARARLPGANCLPMAPEPELSAEILAGVGALAATAWDRLAGTANPFTSHAFLTALEDS